MICRKRLSAFGGLLTRKFAPNWRSNINQSWRDFMKMTRNSILPAEQTETKKKELLARRQEFSKGGCFSPTHKFFRWVVWIAIAFVVFVQHFSNLLQLRCYFLRVGYPLDLMCFITIPPP